MTVLNPNNQAKDLKIIPHNFTSTERLTVSLRDEQTNESFTYTPVSVTFDFFDLVKINIFLPCLYNDGFFEMTVRNDLSEIIYKDRVFCTDQDLNTYTVNQGQYNALNTNNNDYIVL
jgi:hypothetical protein